MGIALDQISRKSLDQLFTCLPLHGPRVPSECICDCARDNPVDSSSQHAYCRIDIAGETILLGTISYQLAIKVKARVDNRGFSFGCRATGKIGHKDELVPTWMLNTEVD